MSSNDSQAPPWGALGIVTLIAVLNYTDRYLPTILAEQIKRDLHLSDTALGVIFGFGFLLVYAVAGIPIARLADRGRYGFVISIFVALWSVLTILGGGAKGALDFALSRTGVAIGEAGSTPASHAFISKQFPQGRRTTALAIVAAASPIGKLVALAGGGYLAERYGWRMTMIGIGAVGLLIAVLPVLFLKGATDISVAARARASTPIWQLLRRRVPCLILAAQAAVAAGAYAFVGFGPAFLMRVHHMSVATAGRDFGLTAGIIGTVGVFALGWLADQLSRRDARWLVGIQLITLLAAVPLAILAFAASSDLIVLVCYGGITLATLGTLAPTVSALHRIVPEELRAQASAMVFFSSAMVGGAGPLLVGLISDAFQASAGVAALGYALLIVVPAMLCLSALLYALTLPALGTEMDRAW